MNLLRCSFYCLFSLLLLACAGNTRIQPTTKNANYTKTVDTELLVIFEIAHLKKAFDTPATSYPKIAAEQVITQLKTALSKKGVRVSGEVVDLSVDRAGIGRAIAKHRDKKQILAIHASSFETSQTTYYGTPTGPALWSGKVQWTLRLFDLDKNFSPDGKAVWTAKTDNVQFGNPCIAKNDSYAYCADKFVSAVVTQLTADGLLSR